MSNRVAAAHWPWTVQRPPPFTSSWTVTGRRSRRRCLHWTPAAAELERLRRQVFWSRFLEIPELHVKVLPAKLLPADRAGIFPVRWWHRLYWQSVRRLLRMPVDGLAAFKGSLKRLR